MPSVTTAVYPSVESILTLARATVNDMLRTSAGQILTDVAPFSIEYVNAAVDHVQETLANNGISTQIVDNVILTPIPPTPNLDPDCQIFFGYQGYFDGSVMHATPALPPDLIVPLKIWQRQTGSAQQFSLMNPAKDGLRSAQPGSVFGEWEWRQGAIYMVGCTTTQDIRIRYEQSLGDISSSANFSTTYIQIPRSKRAIAYLVAYGYAFARGSPQAPAVLTMAEDAINGIINRQIRMDQRNPIRPRGYRSGGRVDGAMGGSSFR
jgi:hypothetical protein